MNLPDGNLLRKQSFTLFEPFSPLGFCCVGQTRVQLLDPDRHLLLLTPQFLRSFLNRSHDSSDDQAAMASLIPRVSVRRFMKQISVTMLWLFEFVCSGQLSSTSPMLREIHCDCQHYESICFLCRIVSVHRRDRIAFLQGHDWLSCANILGRSPGRRLPTTTVMSSPGQAKENISRR